MSGLFIPGFGARGSLYRAALPDDWVALEPPSFRATGGSLAAYRSWLREVLEDQDEPISLAGHSFGAALAVMAAADGHKTIDRLVLVDPAGLPLEKAFHVSARDFASQVLAGLYPRAEAGRGIAAMLGSPRAALRLATTVRALDLREELAVVRNRGVACTVIAAASDTLTPPHHCRRIARFVGAEYRELRVEGGHMWFLGSAALHRTLLV